jgi:hypothetical protein
MNMQKGEGSSIAFASDGSQSINRSAKRSNVIFHNGKRRVAFCLGRRCCFVEPAGQIKRAEEVEVLPHFRH